MKRLLAALFTLFLACSGSGSDANGVSELADSPGLIAFVSWAEGEDLPSELVVVDEGGDEQLSVDVGTAPRLMSTQSSNIVLVLGGAGSAVTSVVDASSGDAQPVEGAEDLSPNSPLPLVQGERYMVLMSPQGGDVALLDLEQAELTDLTETTGDVNFVAGAHVSPDDRFVALSTTEGLWLIPTDEPSQGRKLSEETTPSISGFADEGATLVFTVIAEGGAEVIAAPVEGDEPVTLASTDSLPLFGLVSPQGDEVALLDSDSVGLVSTEGGDEKATVELSGEPGGFAAFSASGNRFLVTTGDQEDPTYELVDFESEESQELDDLAGLRAIPLPQQTAPRWLFFSEPPESGGLLGGEVMGLDLDDGTADSVMSLEEAAFSSPQSWSPDGRFVLVSSVSDTESSLILADMDAGKSREIASGAARTGAVSYDGSLVVYSEGEGSARDAQVFTVPAEGGEPSEIGRGLFPVWVKP